MSFVLAQFILLAPFFVGTEDEKNFSTISSKFFNITDALKLFIHVAGNQDDTVEYYGKPMSTYK